MSFIRHTTASNGAHTATSTWDRPDTGIIGLTSSKIDARLLSMKVRGNKATVVVAVPRTLSLPTPSASVPELHEIVVTKNTGPSWSYSGVHVLYQDVLIPPSARRGASKIIEMTIAFQSMKGSRTDYVDPESPLPGAR